jgi:type I restriction enzyme S subunit
LDYYSESGLPWYGPANLRETLALTKATRYLSEKAVQENRVRVIHGPALVVSVIGNVGKSALLYGAGSTNQQLTSFELRQGQIIPEFLCLQFRCAESDLIASASSATIAILDTDQLARTALFLPPLAEQGAIVQFIRYFDRRIFRYIQAKQKLIKLLEEQRQAIIHHVMTRGPNEEVQFKPSGVEWLGDVPEHWEVKPLKYFVPGITVGIVIQPARLYVDTGVPALRSLNISSGSINPKQMVYISPASNEKQCKSRVHAGDIVIVRTGQAGVAAIVTPEFDGANCIDLLIVRKSIYLLGDYLLTYLNSSHAKTDVQYHSVGAIQAHYNTATLANLIIAAPPIAEQHKILTELESRLRRPELSISIAKREIELLREYRNRLIADVVTGKLDVRAAAANLPDELEEPLDLLPDEILTEGDVTDLTEDELIEEEVVA